MTDIRVDDDVDEELATESVGINVKLTTVACAQIFQLVSDIGQLPDDCSDQTTLDRNWENFVYIIDQYQQQPNLLDPIIADVVDRLLSFVVNSRSDVKVVQSFRLLAHLTKVRGFKTVIRQLPHDPAKLLFVLDLLELANAHHTLVWEQRYMSLLWLAIICKNPFDMKLYGSSPTADACLSPLSVTERILHAAKCCLGRCDKSKEAAAFILSEFLVRPDIKQQHLAQEVSEAIRFLQSHGFQAIDEIFNGIGILLMLSYILKNGQRSDLLPVVNKIMSAVIDHKGFTINRNTLLRKLAVKVVQRAGMVFLRPRTASWSYKRGCRSLLLRLGCTATNSPDTIMGEATAQEDEEWDIPEEVETVINYLLCALKDSDTIVRWSAAKGFGRIVARLASEPANDVVGSLLELLDAMESDNSWHRALSYDEQRGKHSVGSHVRDAACYVCWSFARAYEPADFAPFVVDVAAALVCVSLFDREINCRRAASAAFQEHVGRQGTFPHGIDVLTAMNYFTVRNRHFCYLDLTSEIGSFPEYSRKLMDYLVNHKVGHWDQTIRLLAAKSLRRLTSLNLEFTLNSVLPRLFILLHGSDLFPKQGAIFGLGEIVNALFRDEEYIRLHCSEEKLRQLIAIPRLVYDAKLLVGMSGELMRRALNELIANYSGCAIMKFVELRDIMLWWTILDENLCHTEKRIREGARAVLCGLSACMDPENAAGRLIVERYLKQLDEALIERQRMGSVMALSAMSVSLFSGLETTIINYLLSSSRVNSSKDRNWAEARQCALLALATVCEKLTTVERSSVCETRPQCERFVSALECCLKAMDDYTIDARGDIGAIVREAAMKALRSLMKTALSHAKSATEREVLFADGRLLRVLCKVLQQCCEKIDRTRVVGGETVAELLSLFKAEGIESSVPHFAKLCELFLFSQTECCNEQQQSEHPSSSSSVVQQGWGFSSFTFPRLVALLYLPEYFHAAMLGFVVSVGDLTESTTKYATEAFLYYFRDIQTDRLALEGALNVLADIFEQNHRTERIVVALLKTLDTLFSSGYLDTLTGQQLDESSCIGRLYAASLKEAKCCKNARQLLAVISVWCGMLLFEDPIRSTCLSRLVNLLLHPFPRIRTQVANLFYEALLYNAASFLDNHSEHVMCALSDTDWSASDVQELEVIVADIAETFDVVIDKQDPLLRTLA